VTHTIVRLKVSLMLTSIQFTQEITGLFTVLNFLHLPFVVVLSQFSCICLLLMLWSVIVMYGKQRKPVEVNSSSKRTIARFFT